MINVCVRSAFLECIAWSDWMSCPNQLQSVQITKGQRNDDNLLQENDGNWPSASRTGHMCWLIDWLIDGWIDRWMD